MLHLKFFDYFVILTLIKEFAKMRALRGNYNLTIFITVDKYSDQKSAKLFIKKISSLINCTFPMYIPTNMTSHFETLSIFLNFNFIRILQIKNLHRLPLSLTHNREYWNASLSSSSSSSPNNFSRLPIRLRCVQSRSYQWTPFSLAIEKP